MIQEIKVTENQLEQHQKRANIKVMNGNGIQIFKNELVNIIHNESSFLIANIKNKVYPIFKKNNQEVFQERKVFSTQQSAIGTFMIFCFCMSFVLNLIQANATLQFEFSFLNLGMLFLISVLCLIIYFLSQQISVTELEIKKSLEHYEAINSRINTKDFVTQHSLIGSRSGINPIFVLASVTIMFLIGLSFGFSQIIKDYTYENLTDVNSLVLYTMSSVGALLFISLFLFKIIKDDREQTNIITDVPILASLKDKNDLEKGEEVIDLGILLEVPKFEKEKFDEYKEKLNKKYKNKVIVNLEHYSSYKSINENSLISGLDYTKLISYIYRQKIHEINKESDKILTDEKLKKVMENNINDLLVYDAFINKHKTNCNEFTEMTKSFDDKKLEKLDSLYSKKVTGGYKDLYNINKALSSALLYLNDSYETQKSRNQQLLLSNTILLSNRTLNNASEQGLKVKNTNYNKKGLSAKAWGIILFVSVLLIILFYWYFNIYEPVLEVTDEQ